MHYKKTDQAHLSLGVRALPFGHPDELVAKVMAVILGGTMSSRLFIELRERRGLAYYIKTQDEPYSDSGYLTTQAGVSLGRLSEAAKTILAEYKKLTREPVQATELDRVKKCLIGRSALQLEASDSVANWYGRQIILSKEQGRPAAALTPEDYYEKIKKISARDITRLAKEIFVNKHLNLAAIGPHGSEKEFKKILHL